METTQTHLRSNPSSTLARPTAQTAVASPAPQKPSACLHTVASGTLQPGLHHHTLLHPLPAGKSPAAGWPLSTGLVLLHEMNRCGVGVGETGCGEHSRGSGCPGVPGDSREQPSSQPAWLSGLPTAAPQGLLDLAFFSLPSRGSAASTTNLTSDERLHFHFVSPTRICPDTFTVSISPVGVWVGRICSGGGWKIPQKPLALAPQPLQHNTGCWQTRSPVGSGEIKPDLTRGNEYIKVKEKIEEALGREECTGMSLSCPNNKLKRNPKHCCSPKQVKMKPAINSIGL